jgi:2,4'-dihydroxyacetophenone dioxygenase
VVFETAASAHTPLAMPDSKEDIITLNITVGDLLYYDDKGQICALENWRTSVDRYLAFCKSKGMPPKDITSFAG